MPDTRPEQVFDENDICDACHSAEKKYNEIDWTKRKQELGEILDRYRNKDGTWWDCIVPVSGGKNSCFQAYTLKYEFGMNPLLVNHIPCEITEVGLKNLTFLRDLGFDMIQVGANRQMYRKMARKGFFDLGDSCWPEHIGIFTAPIRVAVQYKIPLIMWGENSQFELGGPASRRENNFLDRSWLEEFQMYGYRISDLYDEGFDKKDLLFFEYPSDEELKEVGVTGLFLGYYIKWENAEQVKMMKKLGWSPNPDGPVEEAYHDYENLDCKWIGGLHDHFKFLKYGFSRATDQLCEEIRSGRMDREEALRIVRNYEGKLPRKYLPDFLKYLNCTEEEFFATLDRFTNRKIFLTDENNEFIRDKDGNLIKRDYGYTETEQNTIEV